MWVNEGDLKMMRCSVILHAKTIEMLYLADFFYGDILYPGYSLSLRLSQKIHGARKIFKIQNPLG